MSRPPHEGGPAISMSKSSLARSEPSYRQTRWYEYLCIDSSRCQPTKGSEYVTVIEQLRAPPLTLAGQSRPKIRATDPFGLFLERAMGIDPTDFPFHGYESVGCSAGCCRGWRVPESLPERRRGSARTPLIERRSTCSRPVVWRPPWPLQPSRSRFFVSARAGLTPANGDSSLDSYPRRRRSW